MPSMGRRKSVILNGILLTAASVTTASPVARRNSHLEDDLRRDSQQLDDELGGDDTKLRRRPVYGRKSRHGWPPLDLEEEDDFAARALGLTMAGLLARIRLLFGTDNVKLNQEGPVSIGEGGEDKMSIYGVEGGINLGLEEQRLLVAILKKVVGMENQDEIAGWVNEGFPTVEKYKDLHQKINKNLLQFYAADKYGKKQEDLEDGEEDKDIANGDNIDGEWKEGQTETYGEAENIRKIFELFRYKKEEEDNRKAKNTIIIGFAMNAGTEDKKALSANKDPNNTKTVGESSMVDFILRKQIPGSVDILNNNV